MNLHFRSYSDLKRDTLKLAPRLEDVDAIVGIPRSGMLPAAILATHLHKPLGMLNSLSPDEVICFGAGARHIADWVVKSIALVDDSVLTGAAMLEACEQCDTRAEWKWNVTRACVYLLPGAQGHVDACSMFLPAPRVFEWNLFNSVMLDHALVDIDGVLCPDPPMLEDADPEGYVDYIGLEAPLLYRPGRKVRGLVTNRLECHRVVTEAWLARHGIEHGGLSMAPFTTPGARRRMSTPAALKAAWLGADAKAGLMIESHDQIAEQVGLATGKPVISIQSMRAF